MLTNRNYANEPTGSETPDVSYFYDNLPNAKGKLTKVQSSVSTTEYTAFDILGRVTGHKQTTDGTAYTTGYVYNLSGALIEEIYPSGRQVRNTLDADGDLSKVESKKNPIDVFRPYAGSFVYNSAGAVSSLRLGNGKFENTVFNSRLQPTQIGLGSSAGTQNILKLNYTYNTTGNADNNGNVLSQKITVTRPGQSDLVFDQAYTYDSLNRLKIAEEKTGTTTNWKQTFTFDRYGNRNFDEANTTTLPKNCVNNAVPAVCAADRKIYNPAITATDNRLSIADNYAFDAAGNVITDAEGKTFTYDGENKQAEAKNASSTTLGTYYFDGDGKRVKKIVPSTGETTVFVYDAGGKLVAEYSTIVQPATTAKLQYLTSDNLGTPRVNTDSIGNLVSRSDYMPYGEEIISLGGRSSSDKYVADDVRQGFTSKERDIETGLDYFLARIYSSRLGRFSNPDEFTGGPEELYEFDGKVGHNPTFYSDLADPRSLNKYAYCMNNPVNYIDPSGHQTQVSDYIWRAWESVKESVKGLIYPLTDELQEAKNGAPPPDRRNTPLGDFADGNGRNLVKRTWAEMADRTERTFDTVAMVDPTGASGLLKLIVNKAAGRQNSASDYVITIGGVILSRGAGGSQGRMAFSEAKQLLGGWGKGSFGTLSKTIKYHFTQHGAEVGAKDALQYMRKAQAFARDLKGATRTTLDGGMTRYTKGGKYIIKDARGKIISFGSE